MSQEWQRGWTEGGWSAALAGAKRGWSDEAWAASEWSGTAGASWTGGRGRAAEWHGTEWQSNGSGDTWKRPRTRGSRGGQGRRHDEGAGQSDGGGGPANDATSLAVVPWTMPCPVLPTQPPALMAAPCNTATAASSSAAPTLETQLAVLPAEAV